MFCATREIYNALSAQDGLKVFTDENEKHSEVWLQFPVKNGGSYRIKFISTDDDNDVAVRVFGLVSVGTDKLEAIYKVLNKLNSKFRYVKFCCDDDGDVNVEYDYPLKGSSPAQSAMEIVMRFAKIIDEAYPDLMRAMWS